MIINQENMSRLYTAFNTIFNAAFQATVTWYERVAMTVPAATRIMDYRFMLNFPMMKEWLDERQIASLSSDAYLVETKDFESTVEVDRNDIDDDQIGLYNPIVAALGQEAKKHPDQLIAAVLKNGLTTPCFDKKMFFAGDHPVGDNEVSNTGGGASTPWYLLDTSRAIKPCVFQLRRGVQLVRMDKETDEEVFMRKKYRYGVDYRAAAAYGLWQLAYVSQQDLTPDNFATAKAAMMSLKNADGRPLGINPNLLVVPPALEGDARRLLKAGIVFQAGAGSKGGAGITNVWEGAADLLVVPELA